MIPLIFSMPGNEAFAAQLGRAIGGEIGTLEVHRFPDGESCVRLHAPVHGRDVIIVCTLDRPDDKIMPLYFAACVARELGARRVGLVAPYLAYMRQDARFREGEGITSRYFARFLSDFCDWLVTVDPHLHRHHSLSEVYSIPTRLVHAAPAIAAWIARNVQQPWLIGPDAESEQWAATVADLLGCECSILDKTRHGDRDVMVTALSSAGGSGCTPVIVDDIASSGRTLIAAVGRVREAGLAAPICVAVHPVFADSAFEDLRRSGVAGIVSCNTIAHESAVIDIADSVALAVRDYLSAPVLD